MWPEIPGEKESGDTVPTSALSCLVPSAADDTDTECDFHGITIMAASGHLLASSFLSPLPHSVSYYFTPAIVMTNTSETALSTT